MHATPTRGRQRRTRLNYTEGKLVPECTFRPQPEIFAAYVPEICIGNRTRSGGQSCLSTTPHCRFPNTRASKTPKPITSPSLLDPLSNHLYVLLLLISSAFCAYMLAQTVGRSSASLQEQCHQEGSWCRFQIVFLPMSLSTKASVESSCPWT